MSDFTYLPDFLIDEAVEYKTLVSEFENGAEQRRRKWQNPLSKWTLRFNNRTSAEMATVRDFFKNKFGAFMSFTWTNPNDSVEYTVRFVEDSFQFSRKAYGVYDFEFEFIEVK
jgi:phage-related protein